MATITIIAAIIGLMGIGYYKLNRKLNAFNSEIDFAAEYRNKFIDMANGYFGTYDRFNRAGTLNNELYIWLTKNSTKIQDNIGYFGVIDYIAPFQTHKITNYRVILNTVPKFRDDTVKNIEANWVDDCLVRYIGALEQKISDSEKNLKNPIVWFRRGFQEIISLPLYLLNSFGIFSNRFVDRITDSLIYKIFAGIGALITLLSGIVTIIQGKEQTLALLHHLIK